jgi:hypothetical protein
MSPKKGTIPKVNCLANISPTPKTFSNKQDSSPTEKHLKTKEDKKGNNYKPAWRFAKVTMVDEHERFVSLDIDKNKLARIREILSECEGKTWTDILAKGSDAHSTHPLPFKVLEERYKTHIHNLQLDDFDGMVQLDVTSGGRLFGVRQGQTVCQIIWWDPFHKVYKPKGYQH